MTLAEIRKDLAPKPGEAGAAQRVCPDCGELYWDWRRERRRPCADCAETRQAISNDARRIKAGPEWERTVLGQFGYWAAEVKRLGLTPEADK